MVTYNDVKTKIQNFRKTVLTDMTYKRAERAKALFDSVQSTVKYILEQLSTALSAKVDLNVDNYAAQLYYQSPVTAIGEKKVAVDYNDDTTEINGRTVIPFDTFTYDPSLYAENVKGFADALSRRLVVTRIPNSESPPAGDFEDVSYSYYVANEFVSAGMWEFNINTIYGEYGDMLRYAEYDIYNMDWGQYLVESIKGAFDLFRFDVMSVGDVNARIGSGGSIKVIDEAGNERWLAYKFVTWVINNTDYNVEIVIGNKPHKCEANDVAIYVYLTDIHLKATPIRIL